MFEVLNEEQSAEYYVITFQRYAEQTEWNNTVFKAMFHEDLKKNIKDKLMQNKRHLKTVKKLITATVNLNDRLFKHQQE